MPFLSRFYCRGPTAHEIQLGRLSIRCIHLSATPAAPWYFRPWRRLSMRWLPSDHPPALWLPWSLTALGVAALAIVLLCCGRTVVASSFATLALSIAVGGLIVALTTPKPATP